MDKELRHRLLTLRKERDDFCQLRRELREQGNDWLPYPEHLRAVPCGATTRAGTPCKMTTIYHNGRCKLHGGKSTGAKTRAAVSPFDARELERMIVSRSVNRERFIQKIRSPTFEWKKPLPRR